MLNFQIDISSTVSEFSLQKSEVDSLSNYLLDRVVDEYFSKWQDIVNNNLNSTREEYTRGMYSDRPDSYTAIIGLTARSSKLAMMIETGADSFDEKQGFANSPKKKIKKDGQGWYLTIPFRHGTSEAVMSAVIPESSTTILDFMKTGATVGSEQLPEPFNQIGANQLRLNTGSILTYKHKSPIHEGMHRRDISSTESEKRGGYFTFRRVSDNSDPEAFFHPGFTARNFMDEALNSADLGAAVSNAVQDWLDSKLG